MKELVILSGKGGTGKTSLAAAFAVLSSNSIFCDADVDAADLHLLMNPDIKNTTDFQGGGTAVIDPEKCTQCGQCRDLCKWEAISEDFKVDLIECEGCGVCVDLCPEQAIVFPTKTCGQWFVSETRFGPMVHARLGIAEENSGKLVALVRQQARALAEEQGLSMIITDGAPGIGCPVIASIGGATGLLIVTEPTVSGKHDMERVVDLANHFKVPGMICVNKFDLNPDQTEAIELAAEEKGMTIVGRIPFDPAFTKAMIQGKTILEYDPNAKVSQAVKGIWEEVGKKTREQC